MQRFHRRKANAIFLGLGGLGKTHFATGGYHSTPGTCSAGTRMNVVQILGTALRRFRRQRFPRLFRLAGSYDA